MVSYRVLVVDDMSVNLKILENILASEGYETVLVTSGEEALERVVVEPFHCILLDIVMPGIDGFEVINRLKEIPLVSDIPVIFITGEEGPEATVRGFEAGAVDYITKPFHPPEVRVRVRSHIKLYTTIQSLAQAQAETLKQINNAQNSLLKKPEDYPHANFSVYYCSLHAAGGDIYDIIEISETKIGYFVGDFAGHQISTGFLTSSVKALLQQNCNDILTPVESMNMVNTVLCQLMRPGQYLTACYAVLDTETRELEVINMGHPPLLLIQSGGVVVEAGKGGDVLGVFEDAMYKADELTLLPSDRLLLYTDGLIEGESVWSAYTKKLQQVVSELPQSNRDLFLENLLEKTLEFRGEVTDDIMVLVVDVPGTMSGITRKSSNFENEISFPSTVRYVSLVAREQFQWIVDHAEIKDHYGLKLVLYELLSNAVIHGNREDINKKVVINAQIDGVLLLITVTDEGNGFDWQKIMNMKRNMGDTDSISGRGLPLYKAYGYIMEFNEVGNCITLRLGY